MVTPFTVTPRWLRSYFEALNAGVPDVEARRAANSRENITGKMFARCLLSGTSLTVPVEGGASRLKRIDTFPVISEHGKWRREHLGAFNAIYGSSPFFEHLIPEIKQIYNTAEGQTLEWFNSAMLELALSWIQLDVKTPASPTLVAVGREIAMRFEDDLSIFDAIFRLGKETALGFLNKQGS